MGFPHDLPAIRCHDAAEEKNKQHPIYRLFSTCTNTIEYANAFSVSTVNNTLHTAVVPGQDPDVIADRPPALTRDVSGVNTGAPVLPYYLPDALQTAYHSYRDFSLPLLFQISF